MLKIASAKPSACASQAVVATEIEKLVLTVACGIAFGYAVSLITTFMAHIWLLDAQGRPVVEDFVAFWAAGHAALKGAAAAAYDAHRQHAAEVAVVGHSFDDSLGWSYPPSFLFVAAMLASLPYVCAFVLWSGATLAFYAGITAAIVKRRIAFLLACAAPWTLTALIPGQNGFLTAALIGLVLLLVEKRPILAGLALGLLSYKPQFGILFPLALAAGGYWRAFGWAAFGVLIANGLAGAVFGFDTVNAFLHTLSATTQNHLTDSGLGWNKLQSLYGLTRALGASPGAAWASQIFLSTCCAIVVAWCWRGPSPFLLKAAILAAAIPLATPYIFVYDLPILAVAVAFLFRHRSFDRAEIALLVAAVPCVFAFFWLPVPSAFFASLAIAAIAVRRVHSVGAFELHRHSASAPTSLAASQTNPEMLTFAVALGIAVGYAGMLAISFQRHLWIMDAASHPVVSDFAVFWAVGHLALKGTALAVYNAPLEHAAELATIGHNFHQLLGWSYPPLFLFVVIPPAFLPYVPAFLLWCAVTLGLHAFTVAAIAERRAAFMVACAMPWVIEELIVGQNGFLTSAIVGLALLHVEKRPILSGLLLGFLTCKPQFGILFPLALAAGGYWRAFGWAAFGTLVWNGLAAAVFGVGTFAAFLHALSIAADTHLVHSDLGWNKLQSIYGFARMLGASGTAAWLLQASTSVAVALSVVLCWRSRSTPFALKAALLAAATLLVTPYVLYYDVPMLAIALAFLFRQRTFDKMECLVLAATAPFLFAPLVPFVSVPGALFASLAIAGLAARRLYSAMPRLRINPSCDTDATSVPSSA